MSIELVIFDIAGTLIEDHDQVTDAFHAAFEQNHIAVKIEELREWKGGAKREVIRRFVEAEKRGPADALVDKTFADFRRILEEKYVASLKPIVAAEETLRQLRRDEIKTATNTGFYRELRDAILDRLGWNDLFEAQVCSDDVARGRPATDMILRAMEITGVADPKHVMAVGDTPLDLQAATNAGAIAVGVLTGVHPESRLRRETHSHIVRSVADVPALLCTYR
jgi:phosphonatase-like hydrolase